MKVDDFLNGLQNAGYWDEICTVCGCKFQAPNGEEICPSCDGENFYEGERHAD